MAKYKVFTYPGEKATVSWHSGLCIHVAECGHASGDLFVGGRDPWCQPDVVSVEHVTDVVLRCPTGALTVEIDGSTSVEQTVGINTVQVAYNGPLFIRGKLAITDAPADAPGLGYRAALCRCGKSRNKPFCDNSHEKVGFSDYGAVGETGSGEPEHGGDLAIRPIKDGPLMLIGNVTIKSSSGRDAWNGNKVALCRCGESKNKPFCDGSHKKAGFKSD